LHDAHHFYLACNAPDNQLPQGVQRRISPAGRVLRSLPVHGRIAAYDRHTGQEKWHALVPPQHLVIDQFQDVPLLLFASYQAKHGTAPGNRVNEQYSLVSALDKRDGSVINVPNNQLPQSTLTLQLLQVRAGAGKVVVAGTVGGMTTASYVVEFLTNGQTAGAGDKDGVGLDSRSKRGEGAFPGGARMQLDNRDLIRRAIEAEEAQRRVVPRKDG
jgi:hypothetical protein